MAILTVMTRGGSERGLGIHWDGSEESLRDMRQCFPELHYDEKAQSLVLNQGLNQSTNVLLGEWVVWPTGCKKAAFSISHQNFIGLFIVFNSGDWDPFALI